jgi:hypothetical protein
MKSHCPNISPIQRTTISQCPNIFHIQRTTISQCPNTFPIQRTGSNVQNFFSFFVKSSHHKYKKKSFSGEVKDSVFFPSFFCFIRELNPHPPLVLALIPRANSNPILPPYLTYHPPIPPAAHPSLSLHPPTRPPTLKTLVFIKPLVFPSGHPPTHLEPLGSIKPLVLNKPWSKNVCPGHPCQ